MHYFLPFFLVFTDVSNCSLCLFSTASQFHPNPKRILSGSKQAWRMVDMEKSGEERVDFSSSCGTFYTLLLFLLDTHVVRWWCSLYPGVSTLPFVRSPLFCSVFLLFWGCLRRLESVKWKYPLLHHVLSCSNYSHWVLIKSTKLKIKHVWTQ